MMFWRYWIVFLLVVVWTPVFSHAQSTPNHVLQMTGPDDGASIRDDVLAGLQSCTIEAWIRWDDYNRFSQAWGFGNTTSSIGLNVYRSTPTLQLLAYEGNGTAHVARAHNSIQLHQWYHIAAVIDPGTGLQLFINGILAAESSNAIGNVESIAGSGPARLGVSPWNVNGRFNGAMDELRIWDHARTQAQIQSGSASRASGLEQGLKGIWNFEPDTDDTPKDEFKRIVLEGDTRMVALDWESITSSPRQFIVHGTVFNEAGRPLPEANILIQFNEKLLNEVTSNPDGSFSIMIEPPPQASSTFMLVANHLTRGIRKSIDLSKDQPNRRIRYDPVLKPSLNLEGSVYSLDNTPLEHILIEAVPAQIESSILDVHHSGHRFYAWSNSSGVYQFSNLPSQSYRLRAHLTQGWTGLKLNINSVSGLATRMVPDAWQTGSLIEVRVD